MRSRTSFRGCPVAAAVPSALIALPRDLRCGRARRCRSRAAAARDKGGGDRGRRPGAAADGGGQVGSGRGEQGGVGADRSRGVTRRGQAAAARQHDRGRAGRRLADARARYEDALGRKRSTERAGAGARAQAVRPAPRCSIAARPRALIARGWEQPTTGTFRNHGQRVRTMVALAKELGYPASVGALQGNFGTPFENGARDGRGGAGGRPCGRWRWRRWTRCCRPRCVRLEAVTGDRDQPTCRRDRSATGPRSTSTSPTTAWSTPPTSPRRRPRPRRLRADRTAPRLRWTPAAAAP